MIIIAYLHAVCVMDTTIAVIRVTNKTAKRDNVIVDIANVIIRSTVYLRVRFVIAIVTVPMVVTKRIATG